MDDYSRYILSWWLCSGMSAEDVKATLDDTITVSGVDHVYVLHRPRLLSDNGSAYVSSALKEYLVGLGFTHTQGKPCHPMTQGKIQRYHRSMKNFLLRDNHYCPDDLPAEIALFVDHYNHQRYHGSLNIVTPVDVYTGRVATILEQREQTKQETMNQRRNDYRKVIAMRHTVS